MTPEELRREIEEQNREAVRAREALAICILFALGTFAVTMLGVVAYRWFQ